MLKPTREQSWQRSKWSKLVRLFLIATLILEVIGYAPVAALSLAQAPPTEITPASVNLPIPLTNISQVTTGIQHTCALTSVGTVKCWGDNSEGQLGDSTDLQRETVVDVVGLGEVATIDAGSLHTCALTSGGIVKCWGDNSTGQLGDDTTADRNTPVEVTGLGSSITAISAGDYHTCALTGTGGIKCWGWNSYGQLGIGDTTDRTAPVDVSVTDIIAISGGDKHTCALTSLGTVKCWGDNSTGQLGDGTTVNHSTPVDVVGLGGGFGFLSAGYAHTCVLGAEGAAKCWGENEYHQLGDGTNVNRTTPVDVNGLGYGIAAIYAGDYHTCALTGIGGVKCWGWNSVGQLGSGGPIGSFLTVVDVVGLQRGITTLSGRWDHVCAVTNAGGVKCWGENDYGQLGDTTQTDRSLPSDVLTRATCYELTLTHTGNGGDPVVTPAASPECLPGHYLPGTVVSLVATPATNSVVRNWSGTQQDSLRDSANLLTIPAADHTVGVNYGVCHLLTLSHTGSGSAPVAAPDHSVGCSPGTYAEGDVITLVAAPATAHRVASWQGATQTPGDGVLVNTLTSPNSAGAVSVAYEPCHLLTATTSGQGEPLQIEPAATYGCDATTFVSGQQVTLVAAPAAGWQVASWQGTADDGSTGNSNHVTIPDAVAASGIAVSVTYTRIATPDEENIHIFLPNVVNKQQR